MMTVILPSMSDVLRLVDSNLVEVNLRVVVFIWSLNLSIVDKDIKSLREGMG
jgi:hypothetical protein